MCPELGFEALVPKLYGSSRFALPLGNSKKLQVNLEVECSKVAREGDSRLRNPNVHTQTSGLRHPRDTLYASMYHGLGLQLITAL